MLAPGAPAIVVFARHPTPGNVKTRLARTVGDDAAARLYRLLAERIITAAARCVVPYFNTKLCCRHVFAHPPTRRRLLLLAERSVAKGACYLFYSKGEEREAIIHWLEPLQLVRLAAASAGLRRCRALPPRAPRPPTESSQGEVKYEAQLQSEDLGERMAHALRHVQGEGHSRALLVGTDVPDLTPAVLQAALAALQSYQVRRAWPLLGIIMERPSCNSNSIPSCNISLPSCTNNSLLTDLLRRLRGAAGGVWGGGGWGLLPAGAGGAPPRRPLPGNRLEHGHRPGQEREQRPGPRADRGTPRHAPDAGRHRYGGGLAPMAGRAEQWGPDAPPRRCPGKRAAPASRCPALG